MTELPPPIPGLLMAGAVIAILCAAECWTFVWMYRKVNKTQEGRHLFRLSFLLGLVFSMTVVFAFIPDHYLMKAIAQLLIFVAIAAEFWVRIQLLRANQRKVKSDGLRTMLTGDSDEDEEKVNGPS